jgi:molecular chaperone GrpE
MGKKNNNEKSDRKEKNKKLSKKVNELEVQLKRALADYHNLSRRIDQKQRSWRDRVAARLIDKMLDVYDDFIRAEKELKNKGLSMAVDQFWSILTSEGVEKVEPEGQEFDADLMDCVKMVDGLKNQVVKVLQTGYLLNGEVIRPAKVTVGKGKQKEEKENE